MKKKDINVGIAGTGFIGPAHLEALRRNNIHVIGLAEASPELCTQKAAQLGIKNAYPSFEAMVADPEISVVHLATPNVLHFSQAKAALEAGKHVVCEKPLAMTTSESAKLVRLASKNNLVNAINFSLRFYPISHHARSLVQSGEIGKVFSIHGSYLQDWLLYETDWNWRLDPELGGSLRAVADIGSHWLDLTSFISGLKITSVMADLKTFHPTRKKPSKPVETYTGKLLQPSDFVDQPITTEDYAAILIHFENDARGVLTVSQVSAGRKNRLFYEIDGSQSSISFESERPNELWIGHRDQPNEVVMKDPSLLSPEARTIASFPGGHNEGFPDTFKQIFSNIYAYIRAGDFKAKPNFPTFSDGHEELILCEAIEKSAKQEQWVAIK
jgi:predicted dehydrogenase